MKKTTQCRVCQSNDILLVENFKPYSDLEWQFELYDCKNCGSRMAVRDEDINYFEILYKNYFLYVTYSFITDITRKLIQSGRLGLCREMLASFHSYGAVIRAIEKTGKKNLSILEIGSSTGFLTAYLNAAGQSCYGVEISEKAVAEAKNKFGDFYGFEMPDKKYDVIFMCGTAGGVTDIRQIFDACVARLNPGGFMIFNAPNRNGLWEGNSWVSTPPPDVITLYTPSSVEKAFSRPGFKSEYSELYELVTRVMHYTYPTKFHGEVETSVSLKYRGVWQFLVYYKLKNIYLFIASLIGKATRKPHEYGLIVKVTKEAGSK